MKRREMKIMSVSMLVCALLLAMINPSLATCPCVEGGVWKYTYNGNAGEYFYCSNPNGARTSWCPKKLNDDGTYTSNLPFAYCENTDLEECQKVREANLPDCPCVEGGEWKYGGQTQSYCADPSNAGFEWCATEVTSKLTYAKYAICTAAIKESCDRLSSSQPPATCPCLPGGQWSWTHRGKTEKQSYCQQPGGVGYKPWCPKSNPNVNMNNIGGTDIAYCKGKGVLEACQALEGTKAPAHCPCVSDWKWKEKSYSYCKDQKWCATEVDEDGNYVPGTKAKCNKGEVKVACEAQQMVKSQEGKEKIYGQYTKAGTGCPCWFDMTKSDCACCEEGGVQCGAPLQNWCTSRKEGRQSGCLGIPANHWTLSNTGFPCFWDTSRTDCGWCASGGAQCGPGNKQGQCWDPEDQSYCNSNQGDCLHIPKCDSKATCKFDIKFGTHREHHSCVCNEGWVGNGIQCFDKTTGEASPELPGGAGGTTVSLQMAVSSKYYVYPHESSKFPQVEGEVDLIKNITALFEAGASCKDRDSCNGTFVNMAETLTP